MNLKTRGLGFGSTHLPRHRNDPRHSRRPTPLPAPPFDLTDLFSWSCTLFAILLLTCAAVFVSASTVVLVKWMFSAVPQEQGGQQ